MPDNSLTPTQAQYLLAIYTLVLKNGKGAEDGGARLTDIAKEIGVRLPTAKHFVTLFVGKGLVDAQRYSLIRLTQAGTEIARAYEVEIRRLNQFLVGTLSMSDSDAQKVAGIIESVEGLDVLKTHILSFSEKHGS